MNTNMFNSLLGEAIYRKISDKVRPLALKYIQNKYQNLNIEFEQMGNNSEFRIPDKLTFSVDGYNAEITAIQEAYDSKLNEMIYEETFNFIDKLINL